MFNAASTLQAVVGSIIEWQRPGHRIGRLLMLAGPLYALLAALWLSADLLEHAIGPEATAIVGWAGAILSYAGVALIAGGIPLVFPSGTLPGPRWRIPVGIVVALFAAGLVSFATRPGPLADTSTLNPFGVARWPTLLQVLVDLIWFDLLALFVLAVAALVVRYRRGDRTERLQVRWLAAAVALCLVGFAAVLVELRVRTEVGPLTSTLIAYAGILAMPIAIGIAVTRYRLYEIDRIISRTIGWALVTGVLVVVFIGGVLGLQAVLEPVHRRQHGRRGRLDTRRRRPLPAASPTDPAGRRPTLRPGRYDGQTGRRCVRPTDCATRSTWIGCGSICSPRLMTSFVRSALRSGCAPAEVHDDGAVAPTRRPGLVSIVMIVTSIGLSVGLSLALDWFVFSTPNASMGAPALVASVQRHGDPDVRGRGRHRVAKAGPCHRAPADAERAAVRNAVHRLDGCRLLLRPVDRSRRLCSAFLGDGDPLLPRGRALCRLAAPALPDGNPAWPSVAPTGGGTRRRIEHQPGRIRIPAGILRAQQRGEPAGDRGLAIGPSAARGRAPLRDGGGLDPGHRGAGDAVPSRRSCRAAADPLAARCHGDHDRRLRRGT